MSESRWSSSSRSCLYWRRRSSHHAMPPSHASGILKNHPRSGKEGEVTPRVLGELEVVLPQDMFLLLSGAKQRLARELVGRLSATRVISLSRRPLALKR